MVRGEGKGGGEWKTTAKAVEGFSCFVARAWQPHSDRYGYSTPSRERSMYETPANLYVNARGVREKGRCKMSRRRPGAVSPEGHSKVNCYVCG